MDRSQRVDPVDETSRGGKTRVGVRSHVVWSRRAWARVCDRQKAVLREPPTRVLKPCCRVISSVPSECRVLAHGGSAAPSSSRPGFWQTAPGPLLRKAQRPLVEGELESVADGPEGFHNDGVSVGPNEGDSEMEKPAARRQAKSLHRQRKFYGQATIGSELGETLVEAMSVTATVMLQDEKLVPEFLRKAPGVDKHTGSVVDAPLVIHINHMFLSGRDMGEGKKLLVEWMFCYPQFAKGGDQRMPKARRALRGWRRVGPPSSRAPPACP